MHVCELTICDAPRLCGFICGQVRQYMPMRGDQVQKQEGVDLEERAGKPFTLLTHATSNPCAQTHPGMGICQPVICALQNYVDVGLQVHLKDVGCAPEELAVKVYIYSNQVLLLPVALQTVEAMCTQRLLLIAADERDAAASRGCQREGGTWGLIYGRSFMTRVSLAFGCT